MAEIALSLLPFVALWIASWIAYRFSPWLSLLLALPAAGFLVRLFMIQHDCGHGSLFRWSWANDWIGRVLGVLTLTPYDIWRREHAIHHAGAGNLERRGIGDIETLTVAEYARLSPWGRIGYRLYRNPLVLFGLGPAYLFLLRHRLPMSTMRSGWKAWTSAMATNAGIAVAAAGLVWIIGPWAFFTVHLPIVIAAASIGVWLFYVQHQFEGTVWEHETKWEFQAVALHGSSYYVLPGILRWLTANIGMHHVHHLAARIPFYRLPTVLKTFPELAETSRLTLWRSFTTVKLALWDEAERRLISFREYAKR